MRQWSSYACSSNIQVQVGTTKVFQIAMPVSMIKWCKLRTHTGKQLSCALGLQGVPPIHLQGKCQMITCTPVRRSVSGQGRNLASWLERTSRTEKPSTSRHCPNSSGIGRFAVLGFAAPVSKTNSSWSQSFPWDEMEVLLNQFENVNIILGVSVFHEHSNLNFSVVGRVPGGILGRIHTWWKSHFRFFLFRLQEGKLVPANITVELLLQVCCRWWFSEIRDGERFFGRTQTISIRKKTGHWVMH